MVCHSATILSGHLVADDWRSIRGNDGLGIASGSRVIESSTKPGLKIRWKKKIGSGYSSVVVSAGKAVTMYTDGKRDLVICVDSSNGKTLWTFDMEPVYKGANGSFDGPLSTPVIHGQLVYCLSARGKLFALSLETGKQRWVRDLVKEESAQTPMYGFSTTPLVAEKTLCVLAGTEKGVLIGMDPISGTTRWKAGTGQVNSQSPVLTRFGAQDIVVTGAGQQVIGVAPQSGKLLFSFAHKGTNGSAMMPVPFDHDKILLTNDDSFSRAFRIQPQGTGFDISDHWTDRSIKNTYNVPVALKGHLYAYSTRILTCVDQKTGKPRWKSRKPGDGFLIAIDNLLAIATKKGSLHLVRANPERYDEVAATQVFDKLVWAIPAYADNRIYLRSFSEMACVEITDESESRLASDRSTMPMGPGFASFLQQVNAAETTDRKKRIIERYLARHDRYPIIEKSIAHFVYYGEAKDMALACDVFGARQEEKMVRVPGTDLFYRTLELPPDQRVSYIFLKDFKPILDPRNPRRMTSSMYAGEMEFAIRLRNEKPLQMSWFGMSAWKPPAWFDQHKKSRIEGKLIEKKIALESAREFEIAIYLPPEYNAKPEKRFPVLYLHDGQSALKLGELDLVMDNYFLSHPENSAVVVFLKNLPQRSPGPYMNDVVKTVMPYVDNHFRTRTQREYRASCGSGFGASVALMLATAHPDQFGACAVQSPLVFDQARALAISGFQKINRPTRLYIEWGRFDMHNPVENWDIRKMALSMKEEIGRNKSITVLGGEVNDSTDWGSWKYRFDRIAESVFPAK